MLTIEHFSRITAIPESTLRFYEQEGVLPPAGRTPAGYRLYAPAQILEAKFLYSLRLAAIPMEEVRMYQTNSLQGAESLDRWQRLPASPTRERSASFAPYQGTFPPSILSDCPVM